MRFKKPQFHHQHSHEHQLNYFASHHFKPIRQDSMGDCMAKTIDVNFEMQSNFMNDGPGSPNGSTEVSSDDEKFQGNDFDACSVSQIG